MAYYLGSTILATILNPSLPGITRIWTTDSSKNQLRCQKPLIGLISSQLVIKTFLTVLKGEVSFIGTQRGLSTLMNFVSFDDMVVRKGGFVEVLHS